MLANLPVSIEVGLYKRLSNLDVKGLIAKLESADWASGISPYGLGLPRPVVETLEEMRSGIDFESQADSEVRTPTWYVAEIARNRLAWCVHDDFEACLGEIETWYPQAADRLLSANLPHAAGAVLARGLELAWKLGRHLESLPSIAAELGAVGALDDLRRPEWDWPELNQRANVFRGEILRRMAAAIPALAEQPNTKELPDYLGQAVHWSGDGAFGALVDNDEDLFRDLFPAYFVGALHIVERLRPQVSAWTNTSSAVTWMSEPVIDLIDISGYAMIYGEYHANPALWTICQTPWDTYLSGTNANTMVAFLATVCGHHQRLFAISPRSILRTRREMITTELLGALPGQPSQDQFDDPAVVHASALIRQVAPRGFHLMPYYDARDVFIVRYLMTLAPAAGLDFGITEDKVKSLSELDDDTDGSDE